MEESAGKPTLSNLISSDSTTQISDIKIFTRLDAGGSAVFGVLDSSTGCIRELNPEEKEICQKNGWINDSLPKSDESPKDSSSLPLFDRPRKIINGGYSKKGELATEKDALLLGLEAEDAEGIFICDRVGNLVMFHCKDFSFTKGAVSEVEDPSEIPVNVNASVLQKPLSEASRDRISAIRGWVVDMEAGRVLCRSFSEDSILFVEKEEFMAEDWSSRVLKKCKEGTTIRVFWNGKEWSHSTNRKINCRMSRIPGVEVEVLEIFKQACPDFDYERLDRNIIYVFQVVHRDNQIMNPKPVEKARVYHLASITSSETTRPMELIDPYSLPESSRLPGMKYLRPLVPEEAWQVLEAGRCLVAQKGYEVVQLASKTTEKLMEIRGCHTAPYIPAPLMYLRLSPADRPLLESAVPFHLRSLVKPDVMQAYIEQNVAKLSFFSACALQSKLCGQSIPLTKTLKWLVNRVILNDRNTPFEGVCSLFSDVVRALADESGVTFYRCIRDMEDINNKMLRAQIRQPSNEVKADGSIKNPSGKQRSGDRKGKNGKPKGSRGPPKPSINGNVSIKYVDSDKISRSKKNSGGKGKSRGKAQRTPIQEVVPVPKESIEINAAESTPFQQLLRRIQDSEQGDAE